MCFSCFCSFQARFFFLFTSLHFTSHVSPSLLRRLLLLLLLVPLSHLILVVVVFRLSSCLEYICKCTSQDFKLISCFRAHAYEKRAALKCLKARLNKAVVLFLDLTISFLWLSDRFFSVSLSSLSLQVDFIVRTTCYEYRKKKLRTEAIFCCINNVCLFGRYFFFYFGFVSHAGLLCSQQLKSDGLGVFHAAIGIYCNDLTETILALNFQ